MRPRSRGTLCPSFANSLSLSRSRGRRECRVRAAPAVSCAKKLHIGAHEHTGQRRTLRHPLRNGFTAYFVLSPVANSSCHRRLRDTSRKLGTSNGCQDHTTWPYAPAFRPAFKHHPFRNDAAAPDAAASITSQALRFVTIAKRPSCGPGQVGI